VKTTVRPNGAVPRVFLASTGAGWGQKRSIHFRHTRPVQIDAQSSQCSNYIGVGHSVCCAPSVTQACGGRRRTFGGQDSVADTTATSRRWWPGPERSGIDVVAVGNGEAAVRKISDLRPDWCCDVFMPVGTGTKFQYVKSDPSLAHIPVILLVARSIPWMSKKPTSRSGRVLKKPFVPRIPDFDG